jgi:hypothetical protein
MSEAYKRALVMGWCQAVTAAPFVPTINDNAKPEPQMSSWFTIIWEPDQIETIGYCGVTQETGLLNLIVGGEPNLGDALVAEKSDAIRAELMAQVDPARQFTLERAQATAEESAGSADRWYRLRTPLDYRFVTGGP